MTLKKATQSHSKVQPDLCNYIPYVIRKKVVPTFGNSLFPRVTSGNYQRTQTISF